MSFEVEGKLHKKFDTEQKTESFRAREFVLEIADGQYPQMIKFQLTQDKCDLIDSCDEGEDLKVHFDLRGREWNDKYFTNLNAWRIDTAGAAQPAAPKRAAKVAAAPATAEMAPSSSTPPAHVTAPDFDDDIPF